MNAWLWAAAGLMVGLVPATVTCLRGDAVNRLVGLELAGILLTLILVLLAVGMQRPTFIELAVALALLEFGGTMVFARFLERWL